ncbi:hypothetical protein G3M48_006067 [Beauveria asiatica]|uniref:Uncharacterized protein n=1 Tax=Beauveria asiatica TaxID=1069075 RepID=A0AAW0RQP2_9HYPO
MQEASRNYSAHNPVLLHLPVGVTVQERQLPKLEAAKDKTETELDACTDRFLARLRSHTPIRITHLPIRRIRQIFPFILHQLVTRALLGTVTAAQETIATFLPRDVAGMRSTIFAHDHQAARYPGAYKRRLPKYRPRKPCKELLSREARENINGLGAPFQDKNELAIIKCLVKVRAEKEGVSGIVGRVRRGGLRAHSVHGHLISSKPGVFLLRDEMRDFVAEDGCRDAARLIAAVDGFAWIGGGNCSRRRHGVAIFFAVFFFSRVVDEDGDGSSIYASHCDK